MPEAAATTYVGDEDPETTYSADLSSGAIWIDTAFGYVYTRNDANDGWDPVAARPAASVTAWPFGTILRPREEPSDPRRLLVVLDRVTANVVAIMVRSGTPNVVGDLKHNYARYRWEPDE